MEIDLAGLAWCSNIHKQIDEAGVSKMYLRWRYLLKYTKVKLRYLIRSWETRLRGQPWIPENCERLLKGGQTVRIRRHRRSDSLNEKVKDVMSWYRQKEGTRDCITWSLKRSRGTKPGVTVWSVTNKWQSGSLRPGRFSELTAAKLINTIYSWCQYSREVTNKPITSFDYLFRGRRCRRSDQSGRAHE